MSKRTLIASLMVVALAIISTGVFASSTMVLNSYNPINLGAGSQRVTICDNDVTVDPLGLTFDTATQKFLVSTVSVSNVSQLSPSGCGNWIMELALGYQGGYQITSWSIASSSTDSRFYFGLTNTGTGMAKTILTSVDPTLVQNIAIQMYPGVSCADGGPCALGDPGPGGGPVVYVAATPFTEPVTGKKYKYIEAAPSNWVSGVVDPRTQVCTQPPGYISGVLPEAIGYAKQNTEVFLGNSGCTGISSTSIPSGLQMAGALARTRGSDWNVPTYQELIEMCKVARFGAAVAATKTNCNDSGGSAPTSWLSVNYSSSSKISGVGWASSVNFTNGAANNSSSVQGSNFGLRPIRYFGEQ